MSKEQSVHNSEEYKVKFWFENESGFYQQQTRSYYYYSNKNSHDKVIKECIEQLKSENKMDRMIVRHIYNIKVINTNNVEVNYQVIKMAE